MFWNNFVHYFNSTQIGEFINNSAKNTSKWWKYLKVPSAFGIQAKTVSGRNTANRFVFLMYRIHFSLYLENMSRNRWDNTKSGKILQTCHLKNNINLEEEVIHKSLTVHHWSLSLDHSRDSSWNSSILCHVQFSHFSVLLSTFYSDNLCFCKCLLGCFR